MIIETPYKNGDTVSIKLTSGEELVARLDEETNEQIALHKPLMVAATQQGLGLAPFMFTVSPETKVKLNKTNVLCVVKTDEQMASQYIQSTTGIAV